MLSQTLEKLIFSEDTLVLYRQEIVDGTEAMIWKDSWKVDDYEDDLMSKVLWIGRRRILWVLPKQWCGKDSWKVDVFEKDGWEIDDSENNSWKIDVFEKDSWEVDVFEKDSWKVDVLEDALVS